LAGYLASQGI